jgi:iron complex outermembrane receptor protein
MKRLLLSVSLLVSQALAQPGAITGKVTLEATGDGVHHATVMIVQLRRSMQTDQQGNYSFKDVPAGNYEMLAHMHPFSDERRKVRVNGGGASTLDFRLKIAPVHDQITVTATGQEEAALGAIQSVAIIENMDLTAKSAVSLGEVLDREPGVSKRSSGPGSSRPVVRGFDGDRVLILQDGIPSGTLSYQSGDHGEPVDATSLDRVEVVRGPATLLYGSNAIGGVVNAVTSHHQEHQHPHEGLRGHLTGQGGSNNAMGGGSAGFEYGREHWLLWGGGGGQRTGDYSTPIGRIANSDTQLKQTSVGFGHFGPKIFGSLSYNVQDGRYGVPAVPEQTEEHHHDEEAEEGEEQHHDHAHEVVGLKYRRQNLHASAGVKDLGPSLEKFALHLNYSDWNHQEMDVSTSDVHNEFWNKQFSYRGVFDQRKRGRFSGSFGFMGMRRDYKAVGEEVTTPAVIQNTAALFALEQIDFEHFRVQLGGRFEHNGYGPRGMESRSFDGFSGSAGIQKPLWEGGVFVANYTHSFRAPALEELYAYGPHHGSSTFEIGNLNLKRERGEGLDLALRQHWSRLRGEVNFFNYWLRDYVHLAPTGNLNDGLTEAEYRQGDARYRGTEAKLDIGLARDIWLNLGLDAVNATLTRSNTPLPRIPPLRGHIGLDAGYKNFRLQPSYTIANRQDRLYPAETATAGYGVFDLTASYVVTTKHVMHIFGVTAYNLGDTLYRNHLSFIKEYAPEIGRGVRFHYTLQLF